MKTTLILFFSLFLTSCSPRMVTHTTERKSVDTIYVNNIMYDSIFIYHEHSSDFRRSSPETLPPETAAGLKLETLKPDTLYVRDVSVEFRYKLLQDTIRVIQRDSIPYEVTITEIKEISRPLTWFDHLTRACFWALLGVILFYIIRLIRKIRVRL